MSGDVSALQRLGEQSPVAAVPAVIRALGSAAPEQTAELDALAVSIARRVRRGGSPAKAFELAAAGRRRTPELRLEEAVAAFAVGNDAVVAEIAAADEAVSAAMTPLLQATRGELPAATKAAPGLRPLHVAARVVAHAVRGTPDQARAAIVRRMSLAQRPGVLADEILAAADLSLPERAADALVLLHGSPRAEAAVKSLASTEAILDVRVLSELPRELRRTPIIARRATRDALPPGTPTAAIVEVVRAVGPDVFDDRGAAALYQGFGLLHTDPDAAAHSFDRAVQLGADMLEALRGKVMALGAAARRHPEDSPQRLRIERDAASAADRLAHALERDPRGGPLAAVAGTMAAERWLEAGEARHARASIQRARAKAGGALVDRLDLLEVDAVAATSMKEAERLVDAVIARSPGNRAAWNMKRQLATGQGHDERAAQILVDAAAATKDPSLSAAAREIQRKRGKIAPFEGLLPGQASAGVLARELARTTTEQHDPYPLAAKHREALAPPARFAFDAAAIAIAGAKAGDAALERLRDVLPRWKGSPRELGRLVSVAVYADMADDLQTVIVDDHALDGDGSLRAVADALAVAGEHATVRLILPRLAPSLKRQEMSWFRSFRIRSAPAKIPGVPNPREAVQEIDRVLAPELSIEAFFEEEETEKVGGELPSMFGAMCKMLGVPAEQAEALSEDARTSLMEQLLPILLEGPSAANVWKVVRVFAEHGIDIPELAQGARRRR